MKTKRMKRLTALAMMCCMLFTLAMPSFASVNDTAEPAPVIGVDVVSGIVTSVEELDVTVFLVISSGQEEKVYYISSDREAAASVKALKVGDTVTVNYVLGMPMKYKESSGFPLSSVTVTASGSAVTPSNDYKSHWAADAIRSAIVSGLISGYPDGTFKPDAPITRAEFMTLINKAFKFTTMEELGFSDVLTGEWYHDEVAKAKAAGYISGYEDGTMRPNDPITRQEVAAIFFKLKNLASDEASAAGFADVSAIASWAKNAVGAVVKVAIMKGYPDNTFRPGNPLTRAEAVTAARGTMAVSIVEPVVPLSVPVVPVTTPTITPTRSSGGGGGGGSSTPATVAVTTIIVTSEKDASTLLSGSTLQMSAGVTPANATDKTIIWSVDTVDKVKVGISTSGLLTAVIGAGNVTVTATNGASGVKGAKVIAIMPPMPPLPVPSIGVGAQNGVLLSTVDGSVTYPVTTLLIPDGETATISYFDTDKVTPIGQPAALAIDCSAVSINAATITAEGQHASAGTYYFKITIAGVTSELITLVVTQPVPPTTPVQGTKVKLVGGTWVVDNTAGTHIGIWKAEDLQAINETSNGVFDTNGDGSNLDEDYVLMTDIDFESVDCYRDASQKAAYTSNEGFDPIGDGSNRFSGEFDGDGHTINHLYVNRNTEYCIGLFGAADSAIIKNIGIENCNITGYSNVGGLLGDNSDSPITECHVTGSVTGIRNYVGGLVGSNASSAITESYATAAVTGNGNYAGGLVGDNSNSEITESYATGAVSSSGYVGGLVGDNNAYSGITDSYATGAVTGRDYYVGGLVGSNSNSLITNSYATGAVTGSQYYLGGLVGKNESSAITGSYATGSVTGSDLYVGGLIGYNFNNSPITESYATGVVTSSSSYVGGLVGQNMDSLVKNSYATGTVTGSSSVGGLVGNNSSSIENCVAFNNSITGNSDVNRVTGHNSNPLTNNYANVDMLVNGAAKTGTTDSRNGGDMTYDEFVAFKTNPADTISLGATATPTISGTPTEGDTTITGTCVDGATVTVSFNSGHPVPATVTGTDWTLTVTALATDDTISVVATKAPSTASTEATAIVVAQ